MLTGRLPLRPTLLVGRPIFLLMLSERSPLSSMLTGLPPLPSALFSPLPHEGTDAISTDVAIARGRVSCLWLSVWSVWGIRDSAQQGTAIGSLCYLALEFLLCLCTTTTLLSSYVLSTYLYIYQSTYAPLSSPYPNR